jgi:hypothetical protein
MLQTWREEQGLPGTGQGIQARGWKKLVSGTVTVGRRQTWGKGWKEEVVEVLLSLHPPLAPWAWRGAVTATALSYWALFLLPAMYSSATAPIPQSATKPKPVEVIEGLLNCVHQQSSWADNLFAAGKMKKPFLVAKGYRSYTCCELWPNYMELSIWGLICQISWDSKSGRGSDSDLMDGGR